MIVPERLLLSGNEAVALAARKAGVILGTGYPGTPSTEILEEFHRLGGRSQWAPNEKVALEVGLGASLAHTRVIVTMKHVGVNVAADPLFTAAYTGTPGALVVISADDPGMASSQNEQDNRHFAVAAGLPMLEPSSSQEAFDFTLAAIEISERWHLPVLLRMTTRVCHSKTIVHSFRTPHPASHPFFEEDIPSLVMIPAYARPAHRKLRARLADIAGWNETSPLNQIIEGDSGLGIITSGISYQHAREAAPGASFLKLGMTCPLPFDKIKTFVESVERCLVIEEGDPWLADAIRAEGIPVERKLHEFRFGELDVERVRRIIEGDATPAPPPPGGRPPQLCTGCPHRSVFEILRDLHCIVAGDIGCYTLGVLPPFQAMDTCVCMGASIGVGLGLRHALPPEEARRVVSVIGDSTFVHSGLTGLVEMVYNRPETGHVVIILDNGTTAMTGLQEHPGTGRTLEHSPTGKVNFEEFARSLGIGRIQTMDPTRDPASFEKALVENLQSDDLVLMIARKPCLLAASKIREYERAAQELMACDCAHGEN